MDSVLNFIYAGAFNIIYKYIIYLVYEIRGIEHGFFYVFSIVDWVFLHEQLRVLLLGIEYFIGHR
jgi:hypothetical protein